MIWLLCRWCVRWVDPTRQEEVSARSFGPAVRPNNQEASNDHADLQTDLAHHAVWNRLSVAGGGLVRRITTAWRSVVARPRSGLRDDGADRRRAGSNLRVRRRNLRARPARGA